MDTTPYVDGWFGGERETTVIPETRFPFKQNVRPDVYSRAYDREYLATPGQFVPRIDRRTTWTNNLKRSEQLDDSTYWTLVNATVIGDDTTAPDGDDTMDALKELGATGEHSVAQAVTATAAPWEFSIFARRGLGRDFVRVAFVDSGSTVHSVFFDLAAGRVGTEANATGKILRLGRGDFCLVVQCTPAAGAGSFKVNVASGPATISYAGNPSLGVYLWGAQAALGADAPYVSTTDAARTVSAPDRDPIDPFAYLIRENDPIVTSSEMLKIRRTFSRIPREQIRPNSQWVKKPELTGTFPRAEGDAFIVQPEPGVPRWVFYTKKPITSDSGPPATTIVGGTYTLSFDGDTTAGIAYNASAAAVASALNALASVASYGGVTVTGSATGGFTVAFSSWATSSVNAGSIVAGAGYATATGTVGITSAGKSQSVSIKAAWNNASYSMASSLTPAAANPISWSPAYGPTDTHISYYVGNRSIFGAAATGGTYTITLFGETTAPIDWDASNAAIAAAVNALTAPAAMGGYTALDITLVDLGPGKAIGKFTGPTITAGTYTVTVLGQTTAPIAYNASLAAIQTAINALSNVTDRGGVVCSGAGFASGEINFVITFANVPPMTGSPASLVPSGSGMFVNVTASDGRTQTISFTVLPSTVRTLIAAAHGILITDSVLLTIGGAFLTIIPGMFSVPDANTIVLLAASGLLNRAGVFTAVGKQSDKFYTAEPVYTRTKRITNSFLVGVSPGVGTIDDIPLPVNEGDPATLLQLIFSGATTCNLEVGELDLYEDGPVVQRVRVVINPSTL